jgi:hypothetical protein
MSWCGGRALARSHGTANAQRTPVKGAQITIAVASTAGGGYDSYADGREALGKHVPTHNRCDQHGGAGVNAGHAWRRRAKDGTYRWCCRHHHPACRTRRTIDLSMSHIGSANSEIDMCFVRSDAGVKTLAEAREKEVILGGSAEGGATREQPAALNALIGTRFKIVSGYPGTREIIIAIERKEVSGVCGMP